MEEPQPAQERYLFTDTLLQFVMVYWGDPLAVFVAVLSLANAVELAAFSD